MHTEQQVPHVHTHITQLLQTAGSLAKFTQHQTIWLDTWQ